nr:hypothetical protein HmN_000048100 [Hymenolepis microstoma]
MLSPLASHNNQQQSSTSPDEIQLSAANVDAMKTYISLNPRPHSEIEVLLKQIYESVPGISQHAQLIFAFIESVSHFYRTFLNLNNNATERPLDLSYQRHAIKPEFHDTLRQACHELFDHGSEAAIRESILATKFLDTIRLIINSNNENGVDVPMSKVPETPSNANSSLSSSFTSLPTGINERIDLLLRCWGEFAAKYQALIECSQRVSYPIPGVSSPHPLSTAPAPLAPTSTTFTSESRCLPPPPLLTPAPLIPRHPLWNMSYPRCEQSEHSLPTHAVASPHMPINSDDGLFVLSLAARSIASRDTSEMGPLNVDVTSHPVGTSIVPHPHSDVGQRITDWSQSRPLPPPTPGPSTSTAPVGRCRAQSVSSKFDRGQNLCDNPTNMWPTNNFASEALSK